MNVEEFTKTYCAKCGTQRCEGIESEWGEGCQYRWNLDGMDPATEIKRLNDKIWELANKLVKYESGRPKGKWNYDGTCSICGAQVLANYTSFCPKCGSDMREDY